MTRSAMAALGLYSRPDKSITLPTAKKLGSDCKMAGATAVTGRHLRCYDQ